jgi:hypothetical protein
MPGRIKLFLPKQSLVSDITAGDGKIIITVKGAKKMTAKKNLLFLLIPIPITTKATFGVVLLRMQHRKGHGFAVLFFSSSFLERKRGRQTYTRYQTLELEKEFHFNREVSYIRRQLNYDTEENVDIF